MKQRILIVDDEPSIVRYLSLGLSIEGYEVEEAPDGHRALQKFHDFAPHLVVLDRMLPDLDGTEVCARIRAVSRVPVLMLTALNEVDDRIVGLERGADDYVGKPVRLQEMLARVRALLRRASSSRLRVGDLELDAANRQARRRGREARLTPRECDLLLALMRRPGQVLSRSDLLRTLWGFEFEGETNVLEVHVRALRVKLEDSERALIRSVRGVGYSLRVEGGDA
jgi:two-component system response regulator MprA